MNDTIRDTLRTIKFAVEARMPGENWLTVAAFTASTEAEHYVADRKVRFPRSRNEFRIVMLGHM